MATIKSFSDLEQSKKLAEILPLESADMYWFNRHIDLTETKYEVFVIDKSNKYIDFFKSYAIAIDNKEIIPCWSLASLLSVLPEGYSFVLTKSFNEKDYYCKLDGKPIETMKDNPVDACYEMIVKIHELKML